MSRYSIIPLYVLDRPELMSCLPVLCVLGGYTDDKGWAFPSQKTIGKKLGISRQAVSKHLLTLERAGVIQVVHQYRENGGQRSSRYRIIMDIPGEPDIYDDDEGDGAYTPPATPVVAPPATSRVAPPATPVVAAERPNITTQYNDKTTARPTNVSKPKVGSDIEHPVWLDKETWLAFIAHRKALRAPMTDQAMRLMLGKLAGFHNQGLDIHAILEQSILKGWRDVFPIDGGQQHGTSNGRPRPQSLIERVRAEGEKYVRDAENRRAAHKAAMGEDDDNLRVFVGESVRGP